MVFPIYTNVHINVKIKGDGTSVLHCTSLKKNHCLKIKQILISVSEGGD